MELNLPFEVKKLYPFQSHFFKLKNGHTIHYLDEGKESSHAIVLLHGNPTWSFFYRDLIKKLSPHFRVIVPDHLGCGGSDRPQDESLYHLEQHIENLDNLLSHLLEKKYSLVVHDWGGAIGFGLGVKRPERVAGIVAMNTAAFLSKDIPFRIALTKFRPTSKFVIKRLNLFAYPATFMASKKRLSKTIKEGYLHPYQNYDDRIAIHQFVQDIPLKKEDKSYLALKNIEVNLKKLKCPKFFIWGEGDFCFHKGFLKRWRQFYPNAPYKIYRNAGHYLLEDEGKSIGQDILHFFRTLGDQR